MINHGKHNKTVVCFTKGLSLDLVLKLRLLSLIQAESVVLDLADFTKQQTLSLGLKVKCTWERVNFCKQKLNMDVINFFPLHKLKWL